MPKGVRIGSILGKQFGKLTVIEEFFVEKGDKKYPYCKCCCSCEDKTIKIFHRASLIGNVTRDCGCVNRENIYVIGQKFNRLTIIEQYSVINRWGLNVIYCNCKCDCGNYKNDIKFSRLKVGRPKSCGCLSDESLARGRDNQLKDIKGQKFGRLTVIEMDYQSEKGLAYWKCKCDCSENKIITVCGAALRGGTTQSCGCYQKERASESHKGIVGENNPNWKGGKNFAWFDTYSPQLEKYEETRRDPENPDYLQVRCTYCKKWFNPKKHDVVNRIRCINGHNGNSEQRLYCEDPNCKISCSIYNQKIYLKSYKSKSNRPYVDPYWTKEVLKQANYQCEICGSEDNLTAHHIESATLNPILANDIDNGICLCKSCHYKKAHSDDGCTTSDLRCKG